MNIFISSDLIAEHFIIHELNSLLSKYDLTKCTILTTDRFYDKQFIDYAVLNGAEVKIYNLTNFLTDTVIDKIAENIDFLVLFSDMENFFFRRLFEICDRTFYLDNEKHSLKQYSKELHKEYEDTIKKLTKKRIVRDVNLLDLYQVMYVDKLKSVRRVPIHVVS